MLGLDVCVGVTVVGALSVGVGVGSRGDGGVSVERWLVC